MYRAAWLQPQGPGVHVTVDAARYVRGSAPVLCVNSVIHTVSKYSLRRGPHRREARPEGHSTDAQCTRPDTALQVCTTTHRTFARLVCRLESFAIQL